LASTRYETAEILSKGNAQPCLEVLTGEAAKHERQIAAGLATFRLVRIAALEREYNNQALAASQIPFTDYNISSSSNRRSVHR
jgi:hypothetical protein